MATATPTPTSTSTPNNKTRVSAKRAAATAANLAIQSAAIALLSSIDYDSTEPSDISHVPVEKRKKEIVEQGRDDEEVSGHVSLNVSNESDADAVEEVMADSTTVTPYPIRWVLNRQKHRAAAFKSLVHPGMGYVFIHQKRIGGNQTLHSCSNCRKVVKKRRENEEHSPRIICIKVRGEYFLQNPDEIPHICIDDPNVDTRWEKIVIEHHYNDTIREIKEVASNTPHRVTSALSAHKLLERKIRDEDPELVAFTPPLKTSKRAFNRAAAANNIKVENPRDVPEELHEMVVPRPVGLSLPERSKLEDFFLIFQEKRQNMGPYLIFSNLAGIKQLHDMEYFACNGNFDYSPAPFKQIYAIYALHLDLPQRMERTLVAFALMPTKEVNQYTHFFDVLSQRVHIEFGDMGPGKLFLFDHEPNAITSCKSIYNRTDDRCQINYYSFTLSLIRKANEVGLKSYWKNQGFRSFVRELQGAVFLPDELCLATWQHILQNAPFYEGDHRFNGGMDQFINYISSYWMNQENRTLANQWEGLALRAINFHEAMLKSFRGVFSMSHPQLGYFIVEMREELVRQQERAVELLNLPETAADVNANAKQSTSKATAAAAFSQIQANDPTAAEGDRKALEAKHQMQLYLDAHNVNNEIFVPIEILLRFSRHQSKNCAAKLPGIGDDGLDDTFLF